MSLKVRSFAASAGTRPKNLPVRVAVVVSTLVLLAGCATAQGSTVYSAPPSSVAMTDETIVSHGSMVKKYHDATQLAEDATILAVGKVTGAEPVTIVDLLFTRYTIEVESALAGGASGDIAVYLLGAPGWQVHLDVPAYLNQGQRYALFLRPTDLPTDAKGGDGYYVVGPGVWGETSASRFTIWVDRSSDIDLAKIPTEFSLTDASEVLSAERVGASR